jgi:hypothetical protein
MKLTNIKRLLVEDFSSQSSWIGQLLTVLNQFIENVTQALSKGLTVTDNMDAEIREITFLASETVSFKVNTRNRPKGVLVSRFETVSGSAPTSAPFPVWSFNSADSTITINSWFGGLSATAKYRVTFYVHTV